MGHPQLFSDLTLRENENRVDFLELLYFLECRDIPSHPLCGRYTGLKENFALTVGTILVDDYIANWDQMRSEAWRALGEVFGLEAETTNAKD